MIADTELILNADGSIYHLNLKPEDLAHTIILVGDPERVPIVSKYFDTIEVRKGKREFITHTGMLRGKRLSVLSTGIGTDNIDIVLNEIDALINVDFTTKVLREDLRSVDIIRIGTSGSIQGNIPVGTLLASEFAVGFDTLMQFYVKSYTAAEQKLAEAVNRHFSNLSFSPYIGSANPALLKQFAMELPKGITMTAPGFYGPQGRSVRTHNMYPDLIQKANSFITKEGLYITNLEMETAGIYALSNMFGHRALSINAILASRLHEEFCANPAEVIHSAIQYVLNRI